MTTYIPHLPAWGTGNTAGRDWLFFYIFLFCIYVKKYNLGSHKHCSSEWVKDDENVNYKEDNKDNIYYVSDTVLSSLPYLIITTTLQFTN